MDISSNLIDLAILNEPSLQEKTIWSVLTIIIVTIKYCCGRLIGGGVAAAAFKSAMQLLHYRRGS
ncbi:MAG: hypothetical protein V3V96_08735 [Acidiferrobacterales bacterium]